MAPDLLTNLLLAGLSDETGGTTIADYIGNRDFTTVDTIASVGGKIDFRATTQVGTYAGDSETVAPQSALTAMVRAEFATLGNNQVMFQVGPDIPGGNENIPWGLKRTSGNALQLTWGNGTNWNSIDFTGVTVTTGTEYLLIAGYDENNDELFISVNGGTIQTKNNAWSWTRSGGAATISKLWLGKRGNTDFLNGYLGEFALWPNRRLTQEDVDWIWNSGMVRSVADFTSGSSPSIARKSIFLGMGLTIHGQGAGSSGTTVITPEWEIVGKALYHNGELFPIKGYYYDTNYNDPANATVDSHFTTLASTGANVIYTNVSSATDDKIQECRDRNIYMILEENNEVTEAALAAALASDPVLMAMYIFDDMDNGTHTVQDITDKVAARNAAFPNKLTYGSTGTASPGTYSGYVDLQGHQTYSFAGNGEVEGGWLTVMDYPGDLVDASTIPFFLNNLQLYSDGSGYPDADQVRAMHYQAMIRGAIGTVAYSGWGGGGNEDAVNSAALMAEMTELFSEFDLIYEILMLGTRNRLTPSAPSTACYWETDTQVLFIAHNYADRGTGNDGAGVSVTIPTGLSNKAKLASRYGDTFTYTSGTGAMSGSLNEEEVQIFLFDK